MSKKNKELEKEEAEAAAAELAKKSGAQSDDAKADAKKQAEKRKKDKNKKPNIFVRMGRKIKETFSELKRVTWPSFGKALKTTGVVLVIVLIFTVVVTGINYGLSELLDLMTNGTGA